MSQENATGGPADAADSKLSFESLEQPVHEPRKLLPPGKQRPAIEGPRKPWWRRSLPWMAIAALILLVFLIVHSFSGNRSAPPPQGENSQQGAAAITVGQARTGDINIYIEALGTVTPLNTVTVYSQITGRVMAVHYHEGQMVREGDPLIDVDPRPYEAMLTQAQGNLDRDRGLLAEARLDLQRYRDAFSKNAIARSRWKIRNRSSCRTKVPSNRTKARWRTIRRSSPTATSWRLSADGSGCAWWTPETPSSRAVAQLWS